MSLTQDQFLAKYDLTANILGQGYFAVVKVGIIKENSEKVAIKFVNKKLVEKPENLKTETSLLQMVDHAHIVKLIDICDTKDTLFIIMELMEGGELYDEIVKRKHFTEKDASYIMYQLFLALDYLHKRGIVHRDLKLENLLLKKQGALEIKLADFGLSKVYTGEALQTACGTPYYVAPEILQGEGYDYKIDTWAAGVLLYVLLSGRLPFSGDSDVELFRAILETDLVWKKPQFDTVSAEAKDLILRLMAKDPEKRYDSAQALEHVFLKTNNENALHVNMYDGLKQLSTAINNKKKQSYNPN